MKETRKLTRREFLKLLRHGFIDLVLLILGGLGYSTLIEPNWVQIEIVPLKLSRLPRAFSGLKIAQISDIHMGSWMNAERFQHVANLVTAQNPDLLLITGDFLIGYRHVGNSWQHMKDLAEVLAPLAASIPSFGVLGNHDYWTTIPEAVRQMMTSSGVTDLTNAVVPFTRGGERLYLCGTDDVWEGNARLDAVIDQLKDDKTAILLAHEPDFADTSAATGKFDLQISGHSHGGQVDIPFYGPPILPYLGEKYPSGLYKIRNMFQYTNRGVGMTRLAVRFNCPAEITIFVLESVDS